MRNPVLFFLLPRPALVTLARRRRLRAAFRTLRKPLVAIPVYALVLYFWHFSFAFEAAVRHDASTRSSTPASSASGCSCGGRRSSPSGAA